MSIVLDRPTPAHQVVLSNIRWQTYLAMLEDLGDKRNIRLAFNQGVLEIDMPSMQHESYKHLLERIITALSEAFDLDIVGFASTTLNREDLQRGIEPDACYYLGNAHALTGRRFDLATDPPPDLAVEVDYTSSSDHKLAIYAQLGIPELWLCTDWKVQVLRLEQSSYVESDHSLSFPLVTSEIINDWLTMAEAERDNQVIKALRHWVREQE